MKVCEQVGRKNSEDKEVSHTTSWRRALNAVCLNGVGHERDASPNAANSDACIHRTLMSAGIVYFEAPAHDGSARTLSG